MAYVDSYAGTRSVSVSWSAGDTLLAVVINMVGSAVASSASIPGWDLVGHGRIGGGLNRQVAILARRMTSAGSGVVTVTMDGESNPYFRVLRFSTAHVRAVVERRVQNERPVWSGSPEVAAGDVLHLGLLDDPALPSGVTAIWTFSNNIAGRRTTSGVVEELRAPTPAVRTDGITWTIHLSSEPLVPTPVITEPTALGVDAAEPVTVAWTPVPGQTAYAIERSGPSTGYWSGSAWVSSRVNVSGSGSVAVGALGAGVWSLRVAAVVSGTSSPWSSPVSVAASAAPAQPTVGVSSWTSRRPTITVSGSAGSGATLTGYRIEVWQGSPSSGTLTASVLDADGVWQPDRMPDGAVTVRAAIVQNGDQQGPWRTVSGTVSVPPVPAPTVVAELQRLGATVPPGGTASDGLPGVRLTVTTTLPNALLEVSRDGDTLHAGDMGSSVQIDDYTVGSTYQVRVGDPSRDPVEWSPWVPVTLPEGIDQTHWLVAPQAPELSVKVIHQVYDEVAPDLRVTASKLLDSAEELLTFGVPVRARRRARIQCESRWAWERASALLSSGLLLRMGWCPSTDGVPTPTDRFRVEGFDPARFIPHRNIDRWTLDFELIPQTD